MSESAQFVDSEERFRSLFVNNLDLILFQDRTGAILDVNTPFLQLLHRTKEEVIGHVIGDFLPVELISLFREKLEQAFTGIRVQFDVAVQFRGAEPRVMNISKVPLLVDGAVRGVHMVGRDITDLTASHQLIEQQAHKLNTIFESITDALFVLDREWRFTFLNREVERLLQVEREQLLGRNLWSVFAQEVNGEFYQQYHRAVATGQAVHFQAYFATLQLWLEVKAFPSEEGLSVYFSDITQRHEAEAQQEQLTQDLYRHNQDLQQFTYLVSHNLRAPLANALGLARLLEAQSPQQRAPLKHLQTSLEQLDEVLREMNMVLAVRDKQEMGQAEPVVLTQVLEQVLHSQHEALEVAGGHVTVDLGDELRVHGNRAYLYSVLDNLLSNAIKYRSVARTLQITFAGGYQPDGQLLVTVTDNGMGFDLEKAGTDVFKLYKRFHVTPAGRGVGLYLVKAHLEAMGGHVEVQSQVEAGTQFRLFFP
jgi:PAS domain S-box-containing protein